MVVGHPFSLDLENMKSPTSYSAEADRHKVGGTDGSVLLPSALMIMSLSILTKQW